MGPLIFILIVVAFIGIVFSIFFAVKWYVANGKHKELENRITDLKEGQILLQDVEIKRLQDKASGLRTNIFEKEVELTALRDRQTDLVNELNITTSDYTAYKDKLSKLCIAYNALSISYQTTSAELHRMDDAKLESLNSKNVLDEAIRALKPQINVLERELSELSSRKRLAVLNQDEYKQGWWELDVEDKEQELISILNQIKSDYPEIKTDIATIEWKKIWLPKLQDLSNREGLNKKGIYRLVLKNDHDVCYIGQAVNIKERWYEHVKKMIGADTKGNEKLYKYRPEDFYWSVMEECEDLNKAEHYWIEFYGCKERGLNRKA